MANDLNQCEFIGRLGQDPKITTMQNGNIMASFSIACSESWNNKNTGQKEEKTEWINIVAYEKLAEIISQWVKKGQQVFIQGKLQTRKYTDQQGIERYSTSIKAEKMIMLGGSNQQPQQVSNSSYGNISQNMPSFNNQMQGEPKPSTVDSDIPFNALNGQLAHLI